MPELAEVEYFRRSWNPGLRERILRVSLRGEKRIFRNTRVKPLQKSLSGSVLLSSEARGKQMLFRFSGDLWLGVHLGMSGKLRTEKPDFKPTKHDHLVLHQRGRSLVFSDPRLFGLVSFHRGKAAPAWWAKLAAGLESKSFTAAAMGEFLRRHRKLPIKAALLLQGGFPGIGNWMADEILWRAKLAPQTLSGDINGNQLKTLWRKIRSVCRGALRHVSKAFSDPPKGWLFHERWKQGGQCPLHRVILLRAKIGGRTTAWCPECQR